MSAPGARLSAAMLEHDDAAWDAFVAGSGTPAHLQTTAWAAVKRDNGWSAVRAAADGADRVVGAQVLIARRRGVPWGMGYAARGPIVAGAAPGEAGALDAAAIEAFTTRVRTVARQQRLGFVRIEPEAETGGSVERELERAGWHRARHVQPESTRIIDLAAGEEAVKADLHRKCRQSIGKSERLGVTVVEADGSRLEEFHAIHTSALRRAGIVPREVRTYREMWGALAPRGMTRLLFANDPSGQAVATLLLVTCGRRVVDLYGGTTAEGARLRANYLLKWEAIRSSITAGFNEYDLWGLPREGIAAFKAGFGGREVAYVGAWDLTIDRLGAAVLRTGAGVAERVRRWRRRGRDGGHGPAGADADGESA